MNYSGSYSNMDDTAFMTLPDPWAVGDDYLSYPSLSVPQSTYPDTVSGPGYPTDGQYVPDLSAADDAAFSLPPTTEMGAFANLPLQADFSNFTYQVSNQCVGMSTWTYPVVPQDYVDPWSMPGPCMFLSCICHYFSYSLDANSKPTMPTTRRTPRSPSRNCLATSIALGALPLPPTRRLQHLT